jgi:NitT/TauT family transport system substrate-binding protein
MTRLRLLPIAVALAVQLQVACGHEPVPPVRLGTFPGPGNELLFLAQHRGWLEPADFRLVEFINDVEVIRAFRNGSIEAAFLTLDEALTLAQSGMDPVLLFVSAESRGADAVIAHGDVTSLPDLRGRRVAVQVNSVGAYLLQRALEAGGLVAGDVQIVNLPPNRHRTAFVHRDVDAVVTGEPVLSQIVAAGGTELFNSTSLPLELVGVVVVRGDYLEQHGDRAAALCTAWRLAEEEIRTAGAGRDWIAGRMQVTTAALNHMLDLVRIVAPSESHTLLGSPRPHLLATTARIQSVLVESGLLTGSTSIDPLFRWPPAIDRAACRG